MRNNFSSQVIYRDQLDLSFADRDKDLLILDRALESKWKDVIENWRFVYKVDAGEQLKELIAASSHIQKMCELWGNAAHRSSRVIVAGGGSVGDFGGFFASVLKRGVRLVHVPTTWLAAIDSAHGGKTALNVGEIKNQLGTFYPADQVYIFKNVLFELPQERAIDGFGEAFKIFLLWEPAFLDQLFQKSVNDLRDLIWQHLEALVSTKYDIVIRDPYEQSGVRKKLNLGHTFGHALEAATGEPHGLCVLQGLIFALRWSIVKKDLPQSVFDSCLSFINKCKIPIWEEQTQHYRFSATELKSLLLADKKALDGQEVDFIFLRNVGQDVAEKVPVDAIVAEARRQNWLKD